MSPECERRLKTWAKFIDDGDPPFEAMKRARLFEIGLPGAIAEFDTYQAIAAAEEFIVAKTGRPGLGLAFGGRQLVARFFIKGFGTSAQQELWLPRIAAGENWPAIAISEPEVGAHPKHLATRAQIDGETYALNGRKTWVTNGAQADLILVLAIAEMKEGRKSYGLFLVPRNTAGLVINPMPVIAALSPASHADIVLEACRVPIANRVGGAEDAYSAMALPFRDVEDILFGATLAGLLNWLTRRAATHLPAAEESAVALGRIASLVEVMRAATQVAVRSIDEGSLDAAAIATGTRILGGLAIDDLRALFPKETLADDAALRDALDGFDLLASVARQARKARLVRLGAAYLEKPF